MDLPPGVPGPTFVSLSYQNGADSLLLMQDSKLAVDGNVGETIGETAVIQTVELVPGLLAEYVQGIWVLSDNFEPGSDPMATAVWDNNAPNQQLVWEANGVRYTLKSNSPQLTRSDLIAIAQSIR
jgi:hypothetical protein